VTVAENPKSIVLAGDFGSAVFTLLWESAPATCGAVAEILPHEGEVVHGMYSGPAVVMFLDRELPLPPENAATTLDVGELAFTYYPPRWRQGFPLQTSEIYWSYASPCRPTVPGLFTPSMASVFAVHDGSTGELDGLLAWSQSLHREGVKRLSVEAR
jgi:Protein of unknown function (DUF3830)